MRVSSVRCASLRSARALKRWLFTALSFAAVLFVSIYAVRSGASDGVSLALPWQAHALAFLGFTLEVTARSLKLKWSAKAVRACKMRAPSSRRLL